MSEHNEQATFVDYVLWQYRNRTDFIRPLFFAVPNGAWLGGRAPLVMMKMKKEGFLPGVSDILYLQARADYTFLAIELKTEDRRNQKNGGVSEEQRTFIEAANKDGGMARVCYGADDAIHVFDAYMAMENRFMTDAEMKARKEHV